MRIKCVVKQDSKHDTSPKLVLAIEDSSFRVELPNEVQEAMSIEVSQIIDVMNEFIISTHYNIERVLEILVPVTLGTTTEWLNIYRVKKQKLNVKIKCESGKYVLPVRLQESKVSISEQLHLLVQKQAHLSSKIDKMLQHSKLQQEKIGNNKRTIDVAYLFAQPLVSKHGTHAVNQVLFHKEYNKFIEEAKTVLRNVHVVMKAANIHNLKHVLQEGVTILHFSCHGQLEIINEVKTGILSIENDVNNESFGKEYVLTEQCLINELEKLKNKGILPSLIIFNACFSATIAKSVKQKLNISTIGHEKKVFQNICELFTKEFYRRIFEGNKSLKQVFEEVQNEIRQVGATEAIEADKIILYSAVTEDDKIIKKREQNIDWIKKWDRNENMGNLEPISIKKELFMFIQRFFKTKTGVSIILFIGAPKEGKTAFLTKAKMYVMDREIFTDEIWIDCRKCYNILQLKLQHQQNITEKLKKSQILRDLSRANNVLVIFDHCTNIMKYDYQKFLNFLTRKVSKAIKLGKILIVFDSVAMEQGSMFRDRDSQYMKEKFVINDFDLKSYTGQWCSQDIRKNIELIQKMNKTKNPLIIMKALRASSTYFEFLQKVDIQQKKYFDYIASMTAWKPFNEMEFDLMSQRVQASMWRHLNQIYKLRSCDYLYLSTILRIDEPTIKAQFSLEQISQQLKPYLICLITTLQKQHMRFCQPKHHNLLVRILKFPLKAAGVFYLLKEDNVEGFVERLYDCYTVYSRVSKLCYFELLKSNGKCVLHCLNQQRMKLYLTMQSFFSLQLSQIRHQTQQAKSRQDQASLSKKLQIIEQQVKDENIDQNYSLLFSIFSKVHLRMNSLAFSVKYELTLDYLSKRLTNIASKPMEGDIESESIFDVVDFELNAGLLQFDCYEQILSLYSKSEDLTILIPQTISWILLSVPKLINHKLALYICERVPIDKLNLQKQLANYFQIIDTVKSQPLLSNSQTKSLLFIQEHKPYLHKLYKEYLSAYIRACYGLYRFSQLKQKKVIELSCYTQLIQRCEAAKLTTLKRQIDTYVQKHFLNSCIMLVSLPLQYIQSQDKSKKLLVNINLQRYELRLEQFVNKLFQNDIDKDINSKVQQFSKQRLQQCKDKKVVIYLIICDCKQSKKDDSEDIIYLQQNGLSQPALIYDIDLPISPVVFYFGADVSIMQHHYNNFTTDKMFLIMFNTNQPKQQRNKEENVVKSVWELYIRKQITYSILEYFYQEFCKVFFNQQHTLFYEQVNKSFELAKAKAWVKAKLRFCELQGFDSIYMDFIERMVQQIKLARLNFSEEYEGYRETVPAYTFTNKPRVTTVSPVDITQWPNQSQPNKGCEIGSNADVNAILKEIQQLWLHEQPLEYVVKYLNEDSKRYFLTTLQCKLRRLGLFSAGTIQINSTRQYELKKEDIDLRSQMTLLILNNINPAKLQYNATRNFHLFVCHASIKTNIIHKMKFLETTHSVSELALYYINLKVKLPPIKDNFDWKKLENEFFSKKAQDVTFEKIFLRMQDIPRKK